MPILSTPVKMLLFRLQKETEDYTVVGYQQIQGDQYAALYSEILTVELENDFFPFLYPNQYVNFSPDSEASKLALSMVSEDTTDVDALKQIYNYVVNNLTYDYDKAETVETGYLPDVDETLFHQNRHLL